MVKLCFDKIEYAQEFTDLDDSESDGFEKDVDLDKIIYTSNSFLFQAVFIAPKLSLVSNHSQNFYTQLIYSIDNPPPEV